MERRQDWLTVSLRIAALGAGLMGTGFALVIGGASAWLRTGRWFLGLGGILLASGMLVSVCLAVWPFIYSFHYRKLRLDAGWTLEGSDARIEEGIYRLRLKLVPADIGRLKPGSLLIRCNRAVLKAELHQPRRIGEVRLLHSGAAATVYHDGSVAVAITDVSAGDHFYVEGYLQADGPLRVH